MQLNNRITQRIYNGKITIACHQHCIGWALYNREEFFKGSVVREDITEETRTQLNSMRLRSATVLAPGKNDEEAIKNTNQLLVMLRGMGIPCRAIKPKLLTFLLPTDKVYEAKTVIGRIREEMDLRSACPDDAAALAMAVMFAERGGE